MKKLVMFILVLMLTAAQAQTPSLSVSEQTLMGSTVIIDEALLAENGFVVVHAFDQDGELVLTPPLGLIYLEAGTHEDIAIELDTELLAENGYDMDVKNVLPMIHVDANGNQSYEFPDGGDVPVMVNEAMVIAELPVSYDAMSAMMTPDLSVSEQMSEDGEITIDSVTLAEDGFVVVHAFDMNGELVLTPPLGLTYLSAGTHEDVSIRLDPALLDEYGYGDGSKNVLPMVHIDGNANTTYEFPEGPDTPVMVNEQMVVAELPLAYSGGMMSDMSDGDMSDDGMMEDDMMEDDMMSMMGAFEVPLSGSQEVPAVMTEASGSASVSLSGNSLRVTGDFMGLSSPLVAIAGTPGHIHMAAAGENGDVIFPLNVVAAQDGMSGIFSLEAELSDEQVAAFEAGNLYINLHTEMNQGGELRGQLVPGMMAMMGEPMLMVSAQTATANTVMIDSVTLTEDGFVVVHAFDQSGELVLTPPLGLTYLSAGTHDGVTIDLDAALLSDYGYGSSAKDVLPMLHIDANGNQTYEFPDGGDVPVMVNDDMVVANLSLTLE